MDDNQEATRITSQREVNKQHENIQEMMDAGMGVQQIAIGIGVHHACISRAIAKYKLEFYTPFDEWDTAHIEVVDGEAGGEEYEDQLEEIFRGAFTVYKGIIPGAYTDIGAKLYDYTRREYGSLVGYAKNKLITPLLPYLHMSCISCGEVKNLSNFPIKRSRVSGRASKCFRCMYSRRNNLTQIAGVNRYRATKLNLVSIWGLRERELLRDEIACCPLTGSQITHDDHFIPLSSGHCGTYRGNMYPLAAILNLSKSSANPFEWFEANGQRFKLTQSAFDALVAKLAHQNGLTSEEFRSFTYWCFANKRTLEDIKTDNDRYGYKKPSLEIWREVVGLQFPMRMDFSELPLYLKYA